MADRITYPFTTMSSVQGQIESLANDTLKSAGTTLVSELDSAMSEWEGDSKAQMQALVDGSLNDMVTTQIPQAVEALAQILESNIQSMQGTDGNVKDAIPTSLTE